MSTVTFRFSMIALLGVGIVFWVGVELWFVFAFRMVSFTAQQMKRLEGQLLRQTKRLTSVLRWEPMLGTTVLICVGCSHSSYTVLESIMTRSLRLFSCIRRSSIP